ncbi:hypothetical protein KBA73_02285 [Patescibacteria group bacterium]|nr:hypothetical protein [Patescibacteria group bacterium]
MARTSRTADDGIKWLLFLLAWEAKIYEDISKESLAREAEEGRLLDELMTIRLRPDQYRGLIGADTFRETIRRFIEAGILAETDAAQDDPAVETYQLLISPRRCLVERISHRYLVRSPKVWVDEVAVIRDVFRSVAGTHLSLDEWLVKTFNCSKREAYRMQARYSNYQLGVERQLAHHLGVLKGRNGGYLLNPLGLAFADIVSHEGETRLHAKVTSIPWPEDVDKTLIGSFLMTAQSVTPPIPEPCEGLQDISLALQGLTEIAPEVKEDIERLTRLRGDYADRRLILQQELDALPAKQAAIDASLRDVLVLNDRCLQIRQELQAFRERTPAE